MGKKLPVDAAKRALRHMYAAGRSDAALSNVLSQAAGVASDPKLPTPAEVKQLMSEVLARGNAARGELVFRRADVGCVKCHSVSGAGGSVGPDLSPVGSSSPLDYVITSILDPNLSIKEAYGTKVVTTTTGQTFTGIPVDRDTVRLVLRDATGKLVKVPVADIDEEGEGKSLMPEGITKFLTHDELLDLCRFVSELGKPGPYAIRTTPSIQRWRVLKQPGAALAEHVPNESAFREHVLNAKPDAWNTAYGMVGGTLPLDELKKTARPEVLYVQGELDVSQPGQVEVEIEAADPTHLWVDAQSFDAQKQVQTELAAGRHAITIRVEVGMEKSPGLKVKVRKPSGSPIQFVVVNGT